jgi:uncharacterized protein
LASIVTVIGVATTMHWMLGYQQCMAANMSPREALQRSMMDLWRPIVWACITDAIGFASLSFAKVGPVQDYGCMMAVASLVVLVGIFVLVPAMALMPLAPSATKQVVEPEALAEPRRRKSASAPGSNWVPCVSTVQIERLVNNFGLSFKLFQIPGDEVLRHGLQRLLRWVNAMPMAVSLASMLICGLAVWGSLRLKVETDFIKNFKATSPLVQAYRAVEKELGGAGVWDVILPAPRVLKQEYLDQVLELQSRLMAIEVRGDTSAREPSLRLTKVMSFADADASSRKSLTLGKLTIEARLLGMRQVMGSFVETLITKSDDGQRYLRIMLRSAEQADSEQKEQLIAEVRREVDALAESESWQRLFNGVDSKSIATPTIGQQQSRSRALVSGYYVLLSQLVSSIVADQWRCFAVATIGIWIAMTIALRSPWLATLTILPNALPSLCILGWMGWMEMRVNLGAAMIAAVSMGLSVDSSLHYLIRFQSERRLGRDFDSALMAAQSDIGMAILLSTSALVFGFGSLMSSNFLPTVVFGTTASISMVGGLLCNLVVLPAFMRVFYKRADEIA